MKIQSILVATDFSEGADEALAYAADLAASFEAEVVLLHAYNVQIPMASPVMSGGYVLPDGFFEEISKQARLRTEEKARKLEAAGLRVIPVVLDEPAAIAIVDEARRRNVDMIVMGTRGLTGLKHVALGSIADKVVRTAPCPVLTVGDRS
jgi:nucleotide-binding universal stress UspA family protein